MAAETAETAASASPIERSDEALRRFFESSPAARRAASSLGKAAEVGVRFTDVPGDFRASLVVADERACVVDLARWAAPDHCDSNFRDVRLSSEVRRRTWSGCDRGSAVVFYIIDGGGHTWPGSIPIARLGKTTDQIDASATIWQFFRSHPLTQT